MAKYPIIFGDTWRKGSFTLDEMETIKRIKADKDEDINGLAEAFVHQLLNYRELISVKLEWLYDRSYRDTFFGDDIDIGITILYYDHIGGKTVITKQFATFKWINDLTCEDDVNKCGTVRHFIEED